MAQPQQTTRFLDLLFGDFDNKFAVPSKEELRKILECFNFFKDIEK